MDNIKGNSQQQWYTSFWAAMWTSYIVLLVSDFADNTFIALAIFALKNGARAIVLPAVLITIFTQFISVIIGEVLAYIVPQFYVVIIAASFFFIFGGVMMYESAAHEKRLNFHSNSIEGSESESEREQEQEQAQGHEYQRLHYQPYAAEYNPNEDGSGPLLEQTEDRAPLPQRGLWSQMLFILLWNEMGDRCQLATVALTATTNFWGVFVGGSFGLLTDTALAILLGNRLKKPWLKCLATFIGGALFIAMGVITARHDLAECI